MQGRASPGNDESRLRAHLESLSRLLLIRLRSLGDSILTLPLVEALHEWRPGLQVDVAVEAPFAPVFKHHPSVHDTLVLRSRSGSPRQGLSRLRAIAEIRRRHYPAVVNLHGGTTSLLLSLGSGAPVRIGQENFRKAWAYNVKIPATTRVWNRSDLHTVEHQLTLLRWLEVPIQQEPRATLYLDKDARRLVAERLAACRVEPNRYFLIHPTATLYTKQWSEKNFARLGDCLAERYGLPVIFSAGGRETQVLLDIGGHAQKKHHYWSDLSLDELFALIEGCRLFIGNDSGPTHAAAALKKPIVVVWGSSNIRAWHPWRTEYELVRSDLPCMPCPGYTCTAFNEPRCILDIAVESVLTACDRILAAKT